MVSTWRSGCSRHFAEHLLLRHLVDQHDRHLGILAAVLDEHELAARLEGLDHRPVIS